MNWRLSHHCLKPCREYGIPTDRVLDVVLNFENEYGSDPKRYRPGTRVRQAKDLAVVIDPATRTIVTVLLRKTELWGRQAAQPETP